MICYPAKYTRLGIDENVLKVYIQTHTMMMLKQYLISSHPGQIVLIGSHHMFSPGMLIISQLLSNFTSISLPR